MQVNDLPVADVARMREKAQPVIHKFSKQVGETFVKKAYSELRRIRAHK